MITTTKELFEDCYGKYAIAAYNVNNLEMAKAVAEACFETRAPFIFQISRGARSYANPILLKSIIKGVNEAYPQLVFAIHLDHGTYEVCQEVLSEEPLFFTSVMIDASHESLENNIQISRKISEMAHKKNISVEAELGMLGGVEEDIAVSSEHACLTDPSDAAKFVEESKCNSLAVAIGTSHGAYKFTTGEPKLHFDRCKAIQQNLPDRFPLVMHGSSSVPEDLVAQINRYGGEIKNSKGVPETYLPDVHKYGVCKVNIDTDLRLAWYAGMRKHLAENPENFDFRPTFNQSMDEVKKLVMNKNKLLGAFDRI
jgi:fructose-bisphosphate aldolase, class II